MGKVDPEVERLARTMFHEMTRLPWGNWGDQPPSVRAFYRNLARLAIERLGAGT
jgi:hypothetical protein